MIYRPGQVRPLRMFCKRRPRKHGWQPAQYARRKVNGIFVGWRDVCPRCAVERSLLYVKRHPDRVAKYLASPAGKRMSLRKSRRYQARHRKQRNERQAARAAILFAADPVAKARSLAKLAAWKLAHGKIAAEVNHAADENGNEGEGRIREDLWREEGQVSFLRDVEQEQKTARQGGAQASAMS